MHQKLNGTNLQNTVSSQPWWRGIGHEAISTDESGEDTTNLSSSKYSSDSLGTKTRKSQDKNGQDDGNDVNKEIQVTIASQSDGKYGHEQQHPQHTTSTMPPTMGQFLTPPTQQELVGHSIACASQPYSDPFYGGVVPAYGPQALVHSYCLGVHPARMALPLEMAEEPVYVNAKQYHGILRRRHSRAKAELEKKLIKVRKPYLHESRHLHAMRRARGSGGRFLNTKKGDGSAIPAPDKGGIALTYSTNSLESSPSNFSGNGHSSSSGHNMEAREPRVQEMHQSRVYSNANGNLSYAHHQGIQLSAFHSLSGNRTEEGDCLGQQHERAMVNGVHRALTIK